MAQTCDVEAEDHLVACLVSAKPLIVIFFSNSFPSLPFFSLLPYLYSQFCGEMCPLEPGEEAVLPQIKFMTSVCAIKTVLV